LFLEIFISHQFLCLFLFQSWRRILLVFSSICTVLSLLLMGPAPFLTTFLPSRYKWLHHFDDHFNFDFMVFAMKMMKWAWQRVNSQYIHSWISQMYCVSKEHRNTVPIMHIQLNVDIYILLDSLMWNMAGYFYESRLKARQNTSWRVKISSHIPLQTV